MENHGKPIEHVVKCGEKTWKIVTHIRKNTGNLPVFFRDVADILGGIHWRSVVEIDGFRSKKWGLGFRCNY
jgi:hypothetical protein